MACGTKLCCGGVSTCCCPGVKVPTQLKATAASGGGDCGCATGSPSVTITYNAVTGKWEGSITFCGHTFPFKFYCNDAGRTQCPINGACTWAADLLDCGAGPGDQPCVIATAGSCAPFSWTFPFLVSAACGCAPGGGSVLITVTPL